MYPLDDDDVLVRDPKVCMDRIDGSSDFLQVFRGNCDFLIMSLQFLSYSRWGRKFSDCWTSIISFTSFFFSAKFPHDKVNGLTSASVNLRDLSSDIDKDGFK